MGECTTLYYVNMAILVVGLIAALCCIELISDMVINEEHAELMDNPDGVHDWEKLDTFEKKYVAEDNRHAARWMDNNKFVRNNDPSPDVGPRMKGDVANKILMGVVGLPALNFGIATCYSHHGGEKIIQKGKAHKERDGNWWAIYVVLLALVVLPIFFHTAAGDAGYDKMFFVESGKYAMYGGVLAMIALCIGGAWHRWEYNDRHRKNLDWMPNYDTPKFVPQQPQVDQRCPAQENQKDPAAHEVQKSTSNTKGVKTRGPVYRAGGLRGLRSNYNPKDYNIKKEGASPSDQQTASKKAFPKNANAETTPKVLPHQGHGRRKKGINKGIKEVLAKREKKMRAQQNKESGSIKAEGNEL